MVCFIMMIHSAPSAFELNESYVCPKTCDLYFSLKVINRNRVSDLLVCIALMDNPVSNEYPPRRTSYAKFNPLWYDLNYV